MTTITLWHVVAGSGRRPPHQQWTVLKVGSLDARGASPAPVFSAPVLGSLMTERRIETGIEINAPPSRVWTLLTDFARMPAWNPFIKSISGRLMQGARLSVYIVPPGKSGMRFKPTVLSVRPERELRWLGHLLFAAARTIDALCAAIGQLRTAFTQNECANYFRNAGYALT